MADTEQADRLRFRMQRIRKHLGEDVDGILANAEDIMDWRYYIKRYPWASLTAVAAAGFLLIPQKRPLKPKRIYLDSEAAKELARRNDTVYVSSDEGSSPSFVKSMGIMAANALVRAGMAYVGQQFGAVAGGEDDSKSHAR